MSSSRSSSATRTSEDNSFPLKPLESRSKISLNSSSNSSTSTPKLNRRPSLTFASQERTETQCTQTLRFDDTSALATLAAYEISAANDPSQEGEDDGDTLSTKRVGSGIKMDRRSTKSIDEELDEEDQRNDKTLRWTMTQEEILEEERIEELIKSRRNRDPRLVIFDVSLRTFPSRIFFFRGLILINSTRNLMICSNLMTIVHLTFLGIRFDSTTTQKTPGIGRALTSGMWLFLLSLLRCGRTLVSILS